MNGLEILGPFSFLIQQTLVKSDYLSNRNLYPMSLAPVCTTELGLVAKLKPEFDKRNTKALALSVDKLADHLGTGFLQILLTIYG